MTDEEETVLVGGFSNTVTRRGDTVRRGAGPWTPTVHALLGHLRSAGFDLAPEPLGFDEQGREVLRHIAGESAWWPWPDVLYRDDGLRAVAAAVRRMGAALETFEQPADAVWNDGPRTDPAHVVRHGDLAPWNTLWVGDRLTGIMDWDGAGPAPRGWDAAQAAWTFLPLRAMDGYRSGGRSIPLDDVVHRLDVWCDELGVGRAHLLDLVEQVQDHDRARLLARGTAGVQPDARFLANGYLETIDADRAWLAANRADLLGRSR